MCKHRIGYSASGFKNLEAVHIWVLESVHWYNYQYKQGGIKFIMVCSIAHRHGQANPGNRKWIYELAKARHLERWTDSARGWIKNDEVWLNPERSTDELKPRKKIVS